jgi:RecJ-like exonuclease
MSPRKPAPEPTTPKDPLEDDMVGWSKILCPGCGGRGMVTILKEPRPCRECDGTGNKWISYVKEVRNADPS